jgi:hypothetical protein
MSMVISAGEQVNPDNLFMDRKCLLGSILFYYLDSCRGLLWHDKTGAGHPIHTGIKGLP